MKEITNLLLAVIVMAIIFNTVYKNMSYTKIKSSINGKSYLVRKLPDQQRAADKLATISNSLSNLTNSLNVGDREGVDQLKSFFNPDNLTENAPGGTYTAYSVNKGEQLALCLRNVKDNTFIEDNTVYFVAIHELAHIMTDEVGHTSKFWDNMKFLLIKAQGLGIYSPQDYSQFPVDYCGQQIKSTPLDS